ACPSPPRRSLSTGKTSPGLRLAACTRTRLLSRPGLLSLKDQFHFVERFLELGLNLGLFLLERRQQRSPHLQRAVLRMSPRRLPERLLHRHTALEDADFQPGRGFGAVFGEALGRVRADDLARLTERGPNL